MVVTGVGSQTIGPPSALSGVQNVTTVANKAI